MSTNWEKYSTAEQTRGQPPQSNGVVALVSGDVRTIPGLSVEHTPSAENRAHTDVLGLEDEETKTERRDQLFEVCSTWLLTPQDWP